MSEIKMIVADDHPIFLDGLCQLINLRHPEIKILASASNGREAIARTRKLRPDVLLVDIRMPEMNGISVAEILKQEMPELKIIMLTTFNEQHLLESAMKAGADGYLLKESSVEDVVESIRLVMKGNILLSSKAARGTGTVAAKDTAGDDEEIMARYTNGEISDIVETEDTSDARFQKVPALSEMTEREREVFRLIIRNYSNEMIARKLYLSERTVRNYVSKIYELTGKHNRSSLIIWAMKKGLMG